MTQQELITAATYAIMKGYDYETMKYGDTMYGKEKHIDEVWEYVNECKEIGTIAFKEKYKEFTMYAI